MCVSHWKWTLGYLCLDFLRTSVPLDFLCPFPDFVLHPFVIINHNCEFDYMVGSVNHPSNSSNLGMFIGTPNVGV